MNPIKYRLSLPGGGEDERGWKHEKEYDSITASVEPIG